MSQTRRLNTFAGPHVQRHSAARHDAETLRRALACGEAAVAPVWNSRLLVHQCGSRRACLLDPAHPAMAGIGFEHLVLLGEFAGRQVFAAEIDAREEPCLEPGTGFIDLRTAGATLPHDEAGLLAYAGALIAWRRRHRYCGSCGAPAVPRQAGHVMACTSADCGAHSFPRIDPAVIVLVHRAGRCLLGRQASWPEGRFSTIAGFVEPGESLEDAVVREVHEETNIRVGECRYQGSQPWPFPASMMLGFHAAGLSDDIRFNDGELVEARWLTRDELRAGAVLMPPPESIARRLIEGWLAAG